MWIISSSLPLYSAFARGCLASKEDLRELDAKSVSLPMWKSKPSSVQTWLRKESDGTGPVGLYGREKAAQKWPSRPGEQQHEWEEPRQVELSLGCTVAGYDFREDLLRALGNSVVEQTAELAFKDLIKKHIKIL